MAPDMIISAFCHERDNEPEAASTTWAQLVDSLATVRVTPCSLDSCLRADCQHKTGMAWSPASWPVGAVREKNTVVSVSCLVIDLDHVPPADLERHLERLAPYAYVLHGSHSDRPDDRCVRLVVQISHPVAGRDFPRFWHAAVAVLGVPADSKTKDSGHLYFLPSRPADAAMDKFDGTGFDYAINEGIPLDVDTILASALPPTPLAPARDVTLPTFAGAPSPAAFTAAVNVLGLSWPSKGRHGAQLALAGALTRMAWPVELIAEFCRAVAEQQEPGNGRIDKRLDAARSSQDKLTAGEATSGWPTLEEHVGRAAVDDTMRLLGVPRVQPDPDFATAMTRVVQRLGAPTRLEIRAAIERARDTVKRSKDLDKKLAAKLLTKVLKGEMLSDHADEDREKLLVQTAIAVVQAVPPNTPHDLICELLLTPAGRLACDVPQVVRLAIEHVTRIGRVLEDAADGDLPEPTDDEELRGQLEIDKDGRARASGHNIERIIRYAADLKGKLRFNLLTKQIEVTDGRFSTETPSGLPVGIKNWLGSHWKLQASTSEVAEQLLRAAQTWFAYDPVAEYLRSLRWDGVPRIGHITNIGWLTRYCGVDDTLYARKVSSYFLISACARALAPGCKVDTVLILEGEQGARKSTALSVLGGAWFTDTALILGDKDSRLLAASTWIVELGELKSLLRDIEGSKAFLTQKHDDFRPPYGRAPERYPRHCVFTASTNEYEYLSDPTGNRRYLAVRCMRRCDTDALARDRDQLWAEATYRYLVADLHPELADIACPGERWWFADDEQIEANEVIAQRRAEDPWVQMITSWTSTQMKQLGAQPPKTQFTIAEIAEHALKINSGDMQRYSHKISRAMRESGFEPATIRTSDGQRRRVWMKRGGAPLPLVVMQAN